MREPMTIAQTTPTATAAPVPLPAPPPPAPLPPQPVDPRERLLAKGAAALADHELLAVLLGTNRPGGPLSALDSAAALLATAGGLPALAYHDPTRLEHEGTPAAAVPPLAATAELARRIVRDRLPERAVLDHLDEVARYLTLRYAKIDREVVGGVYLDASGGWMADEEVFLGTVSRSVVEPRPILVSALDRGASGILLFHTHPSGDSAPSHEDVLFTQRMAETCRVLGIAFHGHLVLGVRGRWAKVDA
jgi:DNA repair protein RadC